MRFHWVILSLCKRDRPISLGMKAITSPATETIVPEAITLTVAAFPAMVADFEATSAETSIDTSDAFAAPFSTMVVPCAEAWTDFTVKTVPATKTEAGAITDKATGAMDASLAPSLCAETEPDTCSIIAVANKQIVVRIFIFLLPFEGKGGVDQAPGRFREGTARCKLFCQCNTS
jgi:hypothetical protein